MASDAPDRSIGDVDWDATSDRRLPLRPATVGFLLVAGVVVAAYLYERFAVPPGTIPPWGWSPDAIGYMLYLALAIGVFYVGVPLARRPKLTRTYWRRLRRRPAALLSAAYLFVFAFVGIFGEWAVKAFGIGENPASPYPPPGGQPPVFAAVPTDLTVRGLRIRCVGPVSDGLCHGSWKFPLGVNYVGKDLVDLLVQGARIALEIGLVTGALVVPIATVVGTAAAYYGGRVDEVLMRVVDLVQVVPAIFVVIIVQLMFSRSIVVIVLVFGLLEWGGTARLVRSEALQRVDQEYVLAAKSAGMSDVAVIRKHLVPNVSNTVVTAVTTLMPKLIVIEAALAYLGFSDPFAHSWGATIALGFQHFPEFWWGAVWPGLALVLTAGSLHVLGDALRDVLDPRMESG